MKIMPGPERDGMLLKGCAAPAIARRKWVYVTIDFDKLGPVKPCWLCLIYIHVQMRSTE